MVIFDINHFLLFNQYFQYDMVTVCPGSSNSDITELQFGVIDMTLIEFNLWPRCY